MVRGHLLQHRLPISCGGLILIAHLASADASEAPVSLDSAGKLSYQPDAFGNVVPDYSLAGYRNGGVALPVAAVVERLVPGDGTGDDTTRIQAAIDKVAALPENPENGLRGAVLLARGHYRCGSSLTVPAGVTLRGEGQDINGTLITATCVPTDAPPKSAVLIRMTGKGTLATNGTPRAILDEKVPIGSKRITVEQADAFPEGTTVMVQRTCTEEWLHDLKMDQIKLGKGGKQWTVPEYALRWQARVIARQGHVLTLDTPVICSIERRYGGGTVTACAPDPRGRAAAVENLRLESVYRKGGETTDEHHAWNAIVIERLVDSWVRDVTALHFGYACVIVNQSASRVTVQDCAMIDPVSQIKGGRRYSFCGGGQYVLFQRCYARNGRHDYVTGKTDVGPTVFLDCLAEVTHSDIGPHHRFSCGHLYDNVKGGKIHIQDRGGSGTGHGWAGNAQVLWNCEGSGLICQKPWLPGTQNWAIGCVGPDATPMLPGRPSGLWSSRGHPVLPRSLYLAQLKERIDRSGGNGEAAVLAVTTPAQRQGAIWRQLHDRFGTEPAYSP